MLHFTSHLYVEFLLSNKAIILYTQWSVNKYTIYMQQLLYDNHNSDIIC